MIRSVLFFVFCSPTSRWAGTHIRKRSACSGLQSLFPRDSATGHSLHPADRWGFPQHTQNMWKCMYYEWVMYVSIHIYVQVYIYMYISCFLNTHVVLPNLWSSSHRYCLVCHPVPRIWKVFNTFPGSGIHSNTQYHWLCTVAQEGHVSYSRSIIPALGSGRSPVLLKTYQTSPKHTGNIPRHYCLGTNDSACYHLGTLFIT